MVLCLVKGNQPHLSTVHVLLNELSLMSTFSSVSSVCVPRRALACCSASGSGIIDVS